MLLPRSPLTRKPRSLRSSLPIRRKVPENNRNIERRTPTSSKFIADSSPFGTVVDMHAHPCALREGQTCREAGAQSLRPPSEEVAGLPNRAAGPTKSSALNREGERIRHRASTISASPTSDPRFRLLGGSNTRVFPERSFRDEGCEASRRLSSCVRAVSMPGENREAKS
jgi:hypothetical protein